MAPNDSNSSKLIQVDLEIGQAAVRALTDSGAEASCCGERWYERHKHLFGGLEAVDARVIGIGNVPIQVKGRTQPIELVWGPARTRISLLVVPTLYNHDVIIGMDILERLGVHIDARRRTAEPTIVTTYLRPQETWRIPAQSSVHFSLRNPIHEGVTLFEPSEKLPAALRSVATISQGETIKIRIDNSSEDEQLIDSGWEIGTLHFRQ